MSKVKGCQSCNHSCGGKCEKTQIKNGGIYIPTTQRTPYQPTGYQSYLIHGTVKDLQNPRVNSNMNQMPIQEVKYSQRSLENFQKKAVESFYMFDAPPSKERREGGVNSFLM